MKTMRKKGKIECCTLLVKTEELTICMPLHQLVNIVKQDLAKNSLVNNV